MYTTSMTTTAFGRLVSMARPREGWLYRDAHYFVAEIEIDRAAARRWTPWPLRPSEPAIASVFTGYFPNNTFGSVYHEAGIFLHVTHLGRPAIFSPWMVVDDDVALILGRELLGYPKKLGAITWQRDGDSLESCVTRRGSTLLTMKGRLGERIASPPPFLGRPHRNVRSSLGLALPAIIAFTPREEAVEARSVDLEISFGHSERDPLSDLGFGRVLASRLHRVNIGSGRGPLPLPIALPSARWMMRNLLFRVH